MKSILLLIGLGIAGIFSGCTSGPEPSTTATGLPYNAYSRSNDIRVPLNPAYRSWSTAQLQQRRHELYYMVPQSQTRHGVPVYITSGSQLPQQDEIRAIEAELNRRYRVGDKAALLEPSWPEERRHI